MLFFQTQTDLLLKQIIDFVSSKNVNQILNEPTITTFNTSTLSTISDWDFLTRSSIIPVHALSDHNLVYW